ncbi:MAG: SRPBCC domain-containing protein [Syntrophaceae bacterium]
MFRNEMQTSIEIHADAERVWQVLTDFAAYQEWNPMIRRANGEARLGARLKVHFQPEGRKRAQIFWPKLITVIPGRELRWLGWPRFPGIFDIDHYWIINPWGDCRTHLLHGTAILGLFAPISGPLLEGPTRRAFIDMNLAHKARAEQRPEV